MRVQAYPCFHRLPTLTSFFPSSYLQASGELWGPVTPAGKPPDLQAPQPPVSLCSSPIFMPCFQSRWASGSLSLTSPSNSGASPHPTFSNTVWKLWLGPNPIG
ncbi:hypothetical protein AAY473_006686 [Plecturocebus cupreus]